MVKLQMAVMVLNGAIDAIAPDWRKRVFWFYLAISMPWHRSDSGRQRGAGDCILSYSGAKLASEANFPNRQHQLCPR